MGERRKEGNWVGGTGGGGRSDVYGEVKEEREGGETTGGGRSDVFFQTADFSSKNETLKTEMSPKTFFFPDRIWDNLLEKLSSQKSVKIIKKKKDSGRDWRSNFPFLSNRKDYILGDFKETENGNGVLWECEKSTYGTNGVYFSSNSISDTIQDLNFGTLDQKQKLRLLFLTTLELKNKLKSTESENSSLSLSLSSWTDFCEILISNIIYSVFQKWVFGKKKKKSGTENEVSGVQNFASIEKKVEKKKRCRGNRKKQINFFGNKQFFSGIFGSGKF